MPKKHATKRIGKTEALVAKDDSTSHTEIDKEILKNAPECLADVGQKSQQHPSGKVPFKEPPSINTTAENGAVSETLAVTIDEDKEITNKQSSIDKDKATSNKQSFVIIESETSSFNRDFPVDIDVDTSDIGNEPTSTLGGPDYHGGANEVKLHIGSDPYGLEDEEYPFIFDGDEFCAVFINKGYHLPSPTMDELEDVTEPSEGQFAFVPPQEDLDEAPVRARSV